MRVMMREYQLQFVQGMIDDFQINVHDLAEDNN